MTSIKPPRFEKVIRVCACGSQFETTIAHYDGPNDERRTSTGQAECQSCREKRRREELIVEAKANLEKAISSTRAWWREECGIEGIFKGKTFDNFKRELSPQAFDALKNFTGQSFLLHSGTYGVGKTHLVCALANHLIDSKVPASFLLGSYAIGYSPLPAFFVSEVKLLASIRQTFNARTSQGDEEDDGDETEEELYARLKGYPLLIIDDVGKVRPRDYSFLQGVYFRILDDRYVNESPVVLTTNLSLKELEEHIGGACADRIREMCGKDGIIKITGKSYRH